MAVPVERPRYTFADLLSWEETRVELLDGEPVLMAPPSSAHQAVSMGLSAQLYAYLKGKTCRVFAAPFAVRLFEGEGDRPEDADTVVEPDLCVICDREKIDRHGCKGPPDLVVEILSPSTQRHDRFTKFRLYQKAGVREYWIIDPDSQTVQTFVLEDGRYSVKEFGTVGETLRVNVLEDCVIDLTEVFAD